MVEQVAVSRRRLSHCRKRQYQRGPKGRQTNEAKVKLLREAFKSAEEEAGKFVVRNEFGEAIEKAGGSITIVR